MNKTSRDKIAGLLYGFAIGDALGIGTEFMTKRVVEMKYPDKLTDYSQIIRDAHRAQWGRGEWSNDTNYFLALIDSMYETKSFDPLDFARRLAEWYKKNHDDITPNMRWVLSQSDFVNNPYHVSKRVWHDMQDTSNPSDALGRSLLAGLWNENLRTNAIDIMRLTHPRPRCEAVSVLLAYTANSLFWKNETPSYETLRHISQEENREVTIYVDMAHYGDLAAFQLDDADTCWYARKALGATLWAIWHSQSLNEALVEIINEGGDADTNAAVAIGMMGLKYGASAIDKKYIDGLCDKERIEKAIDSLTSLLDERFGPLP